MSIAGLSLGCSRIRPPCPTSKSMIFELHMNHHSEPQTKILFFREKSKACPLDLWLATDDDCSPQGPAALLPRGLVSGVNQRREVTHQKKTARKGWEGGSEEKGDRRNVQAEIAPRKPGARGPQRRRGPSRQGTRLGGGANVVPLGSRSLNMKVDSTAPYFE